MYRLLIHSFAIAKTKSCRVITKVMTAPRTGHFIRFREFPVLHFEVCYMKLVPYYRKSTSHFINNAENYRGLSKIYASLEHKINAVFQKITFSMKLTQRGRKSCIFVQFLLFSLQIKEFKSITSSSCLLERRQ